MQRILTQTATVLALVAALLVAVAGAWREHPVLSVALRSLVAGALVWGFLRVAGELAGRSLLRGLAEHQLAKEERSNGRDPEQAASGQRRKAA